MKTITTLKQQIDEVLDSRPEVRAKVCQRFSDFCQEIEEEPGECNDAFNKVIHDLPFEQDFVRPGSLPTVVASCNDVLVAAAVLARIYDEETVNTATRNRGQSGWPGLSKDAKGWCRALLTALPPANATADKLRDLICAKTLAGLLVADSIPSSPRSVDLRRLDKGTILTEIKHHDE